MERERKSHFFGLLRDKLVILAPGLMGLYFVVLFCLRFYVEAQELLIEPYALHMAIQTAIVLGLGALVFLCVRFCVKRIPANPSAGWLALLLLAVTVAPRLYLFLSTNIELTSDFQMYHELASLYAERAYFNASDYVVIVAPNLLLYIIVTGEVFKIFGSSLFVAQCMNLVFFAGSVLIVFAIARHFMRTFPAFLAALVFTLAPDNVLYSLSFSTEPLSLVLYLGGLLLGLSALKQETLKRRLLFALLGGVIFCFANAVRPNAVIAMIAFYIYLLLYPIFADKRSRRAALAIAGAMLLGYSLFSAGVGMVRDEVFQREGGVNFGWTLYEGLDNQSFGGWSPENSQTLMDTLDQYPAEEVQSVLLEKAIERVRQWSFSEWVYVILRKGVNIWIHNDYATTAACQPASNPGPIDLSLYRDELLQVINYAYWSILCALSISCIIYTFAAWRKPQNGKLLMIYLPIIGMIILHSFATSIPRYHYQVVPNMLLLLFAIHECLYMPLASGGKLAAPAKALA